MDCRPLSRRLVFGVGWAALRVATRSLWAPVVAHLAWSSAVLVVRPLA